MSKLKKFSVLVSGGAGLIGSHLCRRLLNDGYSVVCADNLISGSQNNIKDLLKNPHFLFLKHDVILQLPKKLKARAVFHLASPASPNHHSPISYHALAMETMLVNTQGTLELLKFSKNRYFNVTR